MKSISQFNFITFLFNIMTPQITVTKATPAPVKEDPNDKGWAGNFGTNVGDFVGNGLHFVADLGESVAKGAIKWVGNTFDLAWDIAAGATDFVTNAVSGGHGTKLMKEEGWIDRGNKRFGKMIDDAETIKSNWWEAKAGKGALKLGELAGEIFLPGAGELIGLLKGIKVGKNALTVIRQTPAAAKEISALAKLGKAVTQPEVDAIIAKYTPQVIDKALKAAEGPVGKKLLKMLANSSPAEVEAAVSKYPKLRAIWNTMGKVKDASGKVIAAGALGAFTKANANRSDDGVSLPPQIDEKELQAMNDEAPDVEETSDEEGYNITQHEDGTASFVSHQDGSTKTFKSLEEAKADIKKGNPEPSDKKFDATSPEEKKAIATFEELKKANPNLNVTKSISDYMQARKLNPSFENRARLAKEFGIDNYMGTGAQNIALFKIIQDKEDNTLTM
jgi:hypothetical protein